MTSFFVAVGYRKILVISQDIEGVRRESQGTRTVNNTECNIILFSEKQIEMVRQARNQFSKQISTKETKYVLLIPIFKHL